MTDQKPPLPWERQERETRPAFEAFTIYRDMEGRTAKKTGIVLGKSTSLMAKWCAHWKWRHRVACWYEEKDRVAREAQLSEVAKMNRRHANMAQRIQKLVMDRFNSITAEDVSAANLPKFAEVGVKLERQAAGLADEVKVRFEVERELEAFLALLESELEPEVYEHVLRVVAETGAQAADRDSAGEE